MVLQSERACLKKEKADAQTKSVSKVMKRGLRVAGFAFGCCFNPATALVCTALVISALFFQKESHACSLRLPRFRRLDAILVLHEMHYFVYCYCALLIVHEYSCRAWAGHILPAMAAAAVFALSWIPYVCVPNIYKKLQVPARFGYRKTFMLGHGILVLILGILFGICGSGGLSQPLSAGLFMAVWFCTGLGGTTEFCIEDIDKAWGTYNKNTHNAAENIGHIGGVLLSITLFALTRSLRASFMAATAFVLAALLCMATGIKEETT